MSKPAVYNENLLHWVWENRYLNGREVTTQGGEKVTIIHPGYANQTDGPDFTNARIRIGSLKWHGDIEIHWTANDWYHHRHHTDKNYNGVILHVVFEGSEKVKRLDGTPLPTLAIQPFLSNSLQHFFQHYRKPNMLPCSGNLPRVPQEILENQFSHAHDEYFEVKVDNLLEHYDATLPLSRAWKQMLIINLFDGLGISHNRPAMQTLATELLEWYDDETSVHVLTKYALRISGLEPQQENPDYNWKRKGSRPANHPRTRIRQGCQLITFIENKPFKWWLRTDIRESFDEMINHIDISPGIGNHRAGVLFGIVWSPAYYLLGNLTGNRRSSSTARAAWRKHRSTLPGSIRKIYSRTDIPSSVYENKLGAVHQYREYCKPHRCEQCKVFNFIISS